MRIKLLQDARIRHSAGDIVEVSPAEANFLLSTGVGMLIECNSQEAEAVPEKVAKRTTGRKKVEK